MPEISFKKINKMKSNMSGKIYERFRLSQAINIADDDLEDPFNIGG